MTRMHQVEWRFWLQLRRKIDQPLVQWRSALAELKETASAKLTALQICLFEQVCLPVEWMSLEEFLRREFGEGGYGRSCG